MVRLMGPREVDQIDSDAMQLASIALAAEDDTVMLVGDVPTSVAALWQRVFVELFGGRGVTSAELIHPTCWPAHRVAAVARAAGRVVEAVSTTPRSQALGESAVFVELGPRYVAVAGSAWPLRLVDRADSVPHVLQKVCRLIADRPGAVRVDAPADVPGAAEFGAALVRRLGERGRTVDVPRLEDRRCVAGPAPSSAAPPPRRRRVSRGAAAIPVGLAVAGLLVGGMHLRKTESIPHEAAPDSELLVEGSLAVEVPVDWIVRRITGGPGSNRVQVVSPHDPQVALHITQSRVPRTELAATATTLADAMAAQPAGVFVDFDASAHRAGRPAVTYRELRSGHEVEWTVVQDGDLRISIGCQTAPGGWAAIEAVCERAALSAHQVR
jgi:type VII secretion-associated protein (TIGR03931 family)